MINHDHDYIDQLLQGKIEPENHDSLHVELMNAMAQPHPGFVQRLEDKLKTQDDIDYSRLNNKQRLYGLRILLVALLSMLTITGFVFAIDSLFQRVIEEDSGLNAVMKSGMGVELNLAQINDNIMVEIPWVYADSSRLSIGYLISTNDSENYTNLQIINPVLMDSQNQIYPIDFEGLILFEDNQSAGQLRVDLSVFENLPDELDLKLTFQIGYITGKQRTAIPQYSTLDELFLLSDKFTFEFTLPIINGYLLQTNIDVVSSDIQMILQEFMIAPSGARAIVCYSPPEKPMDEGWEWSVNRSNIYFDGNFVAEMTGGGRYNPATGCSDIKFDMPIQIDEGMWVIDVTALTGIRTRLPDEEALKTTIEAVGGTLTITDEAINTIELPQGMMEVIGFQENIRGQWEYNIILPLFNE